MKRILAGVITVALLVAALLAGRGRTSPDIPPGTSGAADANGPGDCIERMFAAAERGDVPAYLDCFVGAERARLDRELTGVSADQFATSLIDSIAQLKGRAVSVSAIDASGGDNCIVTVERIYQNRTERQRYELILRRDGWRIRGIQAATPRQPDKAYGTPVWE